jgi:AcrR family transcriptional regulator
VVNVNPTRRYVSRLRNDGARQTRRLVMEAAKELFIAQGYVATTVEQIAEHAGVSKPTVFASVGSKRTILKELHDLALAGDEEPIPVIQRPWYQEVLTEPDPERSLRLYARNVVRMQQRAAELEEVLHNAAAADPELRELWRTSEDERRVGARTVVDALMTKGPLKPGLDRDDAIDLLWTLTSGDTYRRLVDSSQWPIQRYEQWLADTYCSQLLGCATDRLP